MLYAISPDDLAEFHADLSSTMSGIGSRVIVRTLTTPGGQVRNAELSWWDDPGIWAYFSAEPYKDQRWLCWYGIDPGVTGKPLSPAIEINLSIDPTYKQVSGRSLVDPVTGNFYLGHRGGLGGGRGGQMTVSDFAHKIRGFGRDTIRLGDREEELFVIGALDEAGFRSRLHAYVLECVRLRKAARKGGGQPSSQSIQPGPFRAECDQDGFMMRTPAEVAAIRRLHGRVVNALKAKLGPKATNASHSKMRPDLYLLRGDGSMETLFEVKAYSDTQSWFTALGQLVVYGASQATPPRRVLVCPGPLADPAFARALQALDVALVEFVEPQAGPIQFEGLDRWLTP